MSIGYPFPLGGVRGFLVELARELFRMFWPGYWLRRYLDAQEETITRTAEVTHATHDLADQLKHTTTQIHSGLRAHRREWIRGELRRLTHDDPRRAELERELEQLAAEDRGASASTSQ